MTIDGASQPLRLSVVSLFPQMFSALTDEGVIARAIDRGQVEFACHSPREFADDERRTVDDKVYGGGPGMALMVPPLERALDHIRRGSASDTHVVLLSPQGRAFDQRRAQELSQLSDITFIAGRYEGVDQRFIERQVDEELSIGDFVLTGGELPAMVVIDALVRLRAGVLGNPDSAVAESFTDGLLDFPHYTRPEHLPRRESASISATSADSVAVPPILRSGNHEKISQWRLAQSLLRTYNLRPELLVRRGLTAFEASLLKSAMGREDRG